MISVVLRSILWAVCVGLTIGAGLNVVEGKKSSEPALVAASLQAIPALPEAPPPRHPLVPLSRSQAAAQAKCIERAAFRWSPKEKYPYSIFASTVQPHQRPEGIPAECDWILGVRWHYSIAFGNTSEAPSLVFVNVMLVKRFIRRVLPCLTARFVLIIGDKDMTVPKQTDTRFGPVCTQDEWSTLVDDPRVAHVWVAHLDVEPSRKVSPIPVGLNPLEFADGDANIMSSQRHVPPSNILERPLRAVVCGRSRKGAQWQVRQSVHTLCKTDWRDVCDDRSFEPSSFVAGIKEYPFLVCEHGGGIDPSPKAWMALIAGVIPIIQRFPGDAIYRNMPVLFVDSWDTFDMSADTLQKSRRELAHYFNDAASWVKVIERLQSRFWLDMVHESLDTGLGFGWSGLNQTDGGR